MTSYRMVSEQDIDGYTAYRSGLAAITTPGDPQPWQFRDWFYSRYQCWPLDETVSDKSARFYLLNHPAPCPGGAAGDAQSPTDGQCLAA